MADSGRSGRVGEGLDGLPRSGLDRRDSLSPLCGMPEASSFETIRTIGAELGVSDEAMRKWVERGRVPYKWRLPILGSARKRGLELSEDDFVLSTTSRG